MEYYGKKRIFGILGSPRVGKDLVAKYLRESRNFVPLAFADKIKEEFGISKEDFEMAKVSGKIEQVRKDLWEFSAEKKKDNPLYFIEKVIEQVRTEVRSVVITDVRTINELNAIANLASANVIARAYLVSRGKIFDGNGRIIGSEIDDKTIIAYEEKELLRYINNDGKFGEGDGLYKFLRRLEKYFFIEDMADMFEASYTSREVIRMYVKQFDVIEK